MVDRINKPADYQTTVVRSLRLRCPACGRGRICKNWLRMKQACDACGLDLRREPGFFLGSIYFNYGLTALILLIVCGPLVLTEAVSFEVMTPVALAFCVLFPMWFHRYARCLWLGFDFYVDRTRRSEASRARHAEQQHAPPEPAAGSEPGDIAGSESQFAFVCPFCHESARHDLDQRGAWDNCPACGERVLLLPASRVHHPG